MSTLKRLAVRSFFFGVGFALTIVVIGCGIFWYFERPQPWNTNAITATYDIVGVEGEENTFVFCYTLQNNTKKDYSISEYTEVPIFAKLAENDCLTGNPESKFLTYDKPIFIPSGHRIRFNVHFKYSYPDPPKKGRSKEERKAFREKIERYLDEEFGNLDGFILFDKSNNYEICLQRGWQVPSEEDAQKN